ncbi:MAG: alkaline phosphatase family protein [Armatimonadota bacterium]
MSERIIVIGMDGADPQLALTWAAQGHLPALQSLVERGSSGVLDSTPNAMSPAAWSSFATGLNPGRHGVFYFLDRKPGTYDLMHSGPKTREGMTFWRALSQAGKRVAILHEPMTYPAEAVNGVQLCGWLAPSSNAPGYTYPPEFMAEIKREFPEFELHTGMTEYIRRGRHDLALQKKLSSIRTKGKLARWVLEREQWDCFVTVFDETDPISHYFWHFMDPDHPEHQADTAQRYDLAIFDTYKAVDAEIGRLLEVAPADAHIFVMSDHGSRRNSRGPLYLKGLLRQMGLEVPKEGAGGGASLLHSLADKLPSGLKHRATGMFPGLASRLLSKSTAGDIDYSRSRAYTFWCNGCAEPWLNIAGRDPQGIVQPGSEYDEIVQAIREALLQATEAGTGEPLVKAVHLASEVYTGPQLDRAPDMLVDWTDVVVVDGLRTSYQGKEIVVTEPSGEDLRKGNHRREGLLIAAGPGIPIGTAPEGLNIQDLPATFLALLATPAPGQLDGRVLTELVGDIVTTEPAPAVEAGTEEAPSPYTLEEEAAVEERLKDLGYL